MVMAQIHVITETVQAATQLNLLYTECILHNGFCTPFTVKKTARVDEHKLRECLFLHACLQPSIHRGSRSKCLQSMDGIARNSGPLLAQQLHHLLAYPNPLALPRKVQRKM